MRRRGPNSSQPPALPWPMRIGVAVEADGGDPAALRRAIGADQGFLEHGAVAGEPAGQRDFGADHAGDARHQFAAVDVEAVGQNENAGEIVGRERFADRFAAGARMRGRRHRLAGEPQPRAVEAQRDRRDFVIDVVVADLAAGAAADHMGLGEHRRAARDSARHRPAPSANRNTERDRRWRNPRRWRASLAPRSTTIDASASRTSRFNQATKIGR